MDSDRVSPVRAWLSVLAVGDFTENAVLLLRIPDFCSHLSQSFGVPAKLSSEKSDLPVVVRLVVVFAQPDDLGRVPVILVMRYDVASATIRANASSQYAAPNQLPGLPTDLLPQTDQWVFELLTFPDLPFRQEDWSRGSNASLIDICAA